MTDQEEQEALQAFQIEMKAKMEAKAAAAGAANKQVGDSFQAENKTKPGVTTTATGLQYKVLTPGTGPKPSASDTVICQYRGTLIDGKEFDSSYKRGQPAQFPVTGVIKGWTEALRDDDGGVEMAIGAAAQPGLRRPRCGSGHRAELDAGL